MDVNYVFFYILFREKFLKYMLALSEGSLGAYEFAVLILLAWFHTNLDTIQYLEKSKWEYPPTQTGDS